MSDISHFATLEPVPKDKGSASIIEYIKENIGCESSIRQALDSLSQSTKEDATGIDADAKHIVARVMQENSSNEDIQRFGCQIYSNIAIAGDRDITKYTLNKS